MPGSFPRGKGLADEACFEIQKNTGLTLPAIKERHAWLESQLGY